ncbi:MAG: HAMP domain-containing sensor histidine kinase [Bacteroidales bacterium]|nr:HAMP domain-containing sensor histidine kinase [Bacteroidales bacterium]MDD4670656.1 HAMP domain-containing sensor histidine kinase [Bacteroidales bacterium]
MKIKKRIANFYTSLTAISVFVFMGTIFLVVNYNLDKRFHTYLLEKARFVSEQLSMEDMESEKFDYDKVMKRFSSVFTATEDTIVDYDNLLTDNVLSEYMSDNQVKRLKNAGHVHTRHKSKYATALYLPNNGDAKVVLITAYNDYGGNAHNIFLKIMISVFITSVVVIYFAGEVFATNILKPFRSVLRQIRRIRSTNLNERIVTDHTCEEVEELAQALNKMISQLDIAFESQKNFISHASHELNNPMTAILGECDIILSKERSSEEYRGAIQRISTETERLESLIKDLFVLAKSDMEIMNYHLETYNAGEFIQNMCDEINYKEKSERLVFSCHCDANIMVNNHLFSIAVGNILDNACKYSTEKKVYVTIASAPDGNNISISVRDNGIGIPKEELSKIFQSFYRAHNTRSYSGQGIGLALSQKIIKSYNGTIDVKSEEGEGTEFIITLATC